MQDTCSNHPKMLIYLKRLLTFETVFLRHVKYRTLITENKKYMDYS